MCLGSTDTKVDMPKPDPLPDPIPAPPPPKEQAAQPKILEDTTKSAEIRIGGANKDTRRDTTGSSGTGSESLTIGNNQGLTI